MSGSGAVVDGFERWLLRERGLAQGTVAMYRSYVGRWVGWAQARDMEPLVSGDAVREWSDTLPTGVSTRDNAKAAIKLLCVWQDVEDVSGAVVRAQVNARNLRMVMPRDEARTLMGVAQRRGHDGTAVIVALTTGMDVRELRRLHWTDVDWTNRTVRFARRRGEPAHAVRLDPVLRHRLDTHRPDDPARAGFVFTTSDGGQRSDQSMRSWIARVTEQAGLGWVVPSDLRRTAGRAAYEQAGRDLVAAQTFLGFDEPDAAGRYIRTDLDGQRAPLPDGCSYWSRP